MSDEYDVVVIGAGPVGENAAQYAIEGTDLTACLVERELVGGECSYWACMPSKALLRPVEVAAVTADLGGLSEAAIDIRGLTKRRDEWVSSYDDAGQVSWANEAGLHVVRGEARLTGPRTVTVTGTSGTRVLTARKAVVIATGSEAVVPEAFADALPWGSRDATGVVEVPGRLAVVGGGVVACEAATWLAAMGSRVTMLVRGERLLGAYEPFVGEAVQAGLEQRGVEVRLGADVTACARKDARDTGLGRVHGGEVTLTVGGTALVVDEVLVATGRRPRLDDLGLANVGLTSDDVLQGRTPAWLLAVGDASGEPQLTHWGKYRARVLGARIAASAGGPAAYEPRREVPVPQVVFTDPQVASVGMTEQQARDAGIEVVTAQVPISSASGVSLLRDTVEGNAQLVVDADRRVLVGATFVGPEVAELVHGATIAIVGEVPVHVLRHAVPSYPTASEIWLRLLESLPADMRRALG